MKKLSKIVVVMMAFVMMLSITGCGEKKEKNLEGTLSELMRELYKGAGINEEEDFMFLEDKEVTEENLSYYLGVGI